MPEEKKESIPNTLTGLSSTWGLESGKKNFFGPETVEM